jgi:hypothetical protein
MFSNVTCAVAFHLLLTHGVNLVFFLPLLILLGNIRDSLLQCSS